MAWCLVVLFLERGTFYWASSRCDFAPSAKESSFRVLVLSDPQIVEKGTYGPISPIWQSLISHFSNEYLRKAWLALSKHGIGAWLWPGPKPADLVPETGMPSSKNERAATWFQHQYAPHVNDQFMLSDVQGKLSWDARIPISINALESVSHELVVVNGPALVGMEALDDAPWASEQGLTNAKAHAASTSQMIDWLGTHTHPEGVFS
ncbi:hypothetical protein MEQU1_000078 [Malassezia equina]|uniref:Uncharacterized protein n=1 Tax=Malassezia equina TaxID=1381935 RepID=A0AAF0IX32_9BASI|nr:hypothetical protein MEQU1_000078 [Malassezia equina]